VRLGPLSWILIAACACILGCSRSDRPELGTVTGKVTLDGAALPNAGIGFQPIDGGRESTGVTDASGNYRLTYLRDVMGAKVGRHRVRISTGGEGENARELVPEKYRTETVLVREVRPGRNKIDFVLLSD